MSQIKKWHSDILREAFRKTFQQTGNSNSTGGVSSAGLTGSVSQGQTQDSNYNAPTRGNSRRDMPSNNNGSSRAMSRMRM